MITMRNNPLKHNFNDRRMLAVGSLLVLVTLTPARGFAQSVATSTTAVEQPQTATQAQPDATRLVRLVLRSRADVPGFPIYFRQSDGSWLHRCTTPCSLRVAPSSITLASSPNGENAATVTVGASGLDTIVLPSPDRVIPWLSDVHSAGAAALAVPVRAGSPGMFDGGLTMIIVGTGLGLTLFVAVATTQGGSGCLGPCSAGFERLGWMGAAIGIPVIFLPIGIGLMVAGRDRPAQNPARPRASLVGVTPIVTAEFQGVSAVGQF